MHSPVFIPIPTDKRSSSDLFKSLFNFSNASLIANAASIALTLWFGSSAGAFQNAIIQSPIYLSIVPSLFKISFDRTVSKLLIKSVKASGSSLYFSEIEVKPLMSENKNVISFRSPPSFRDSLDLASFSTITGDIY